MNEKTVFPYEEEISHIRRRPGIYFGSRGVRGVEHFVYELVANVLDSYLANQATFVNIELVNLEFGGTMISVTDDANGLPFDEPSDIEGVSLATKYFTRLHHTKSHDEHFPHVHITPLGLGLAPLNASSIKLTVRSWRSGVLWEQKFSQGYAQNAPSIIEQGNNRGTTIEVIPDPEIFGQAQPRAWVIRRALFEAAHLFAGIKVGFNQERFHAPEGLQMLGQMLTTFPLQYSNAALPFHLALRIEDIFIEVAIVGNEGISKQVLSWVNGGRTYEGGSHVQGVFSILEEVCWEPSLILIHVVMYNPNFAGPMKTKLNIPGIQEVMKNALRKPLLNYLGIQKS